MELISADFLKEKGRALPHPKQYKPQYPIMGHCGLQDTQRG